MRRLGRMQVQVAGVEFHFLALAVFLDDDFDVAFELVEQFFGFVVVVILSRVGPGDDHDDVIAGIGVDALIADGRFEQVAVFVDPLIEVERFHCRVSNVERRNKADADG